MDNQFTKTLVLDSSYTPRGIISSFRGFVIAWKGNAEVVQNHDCKFKVQDPEAEYWKPSIIRVNQYVNQRGHRVPLNKKNIFKRDGNTCIYCGSNRRQDLTIDHIVPQSRGGKNTWENLVTSCKNCNNNKGHMDVESFTDKKIKPKKPHYLAMLRGSGNIPEEWEPYLFPKK